MKKTRYQQPAMQIVEIQQRTMLCISNGAIQVDDTSITEDGWQWQGEGMDIPDV